MNGSSSPLSSTTRMASSSDFTTIAPSGAKSSRRVMTTITRPGSGLPSRESQVLRPMIM